ncbi:MAG TPA: hypothetical protein VGX94_02795 [Terriglobia bacterium]|nr:hypothetical protein [Terriglobia bacterium]
MNGLLKSLGEFIREHDGINDKRRLCGLVADKFALTKDRSVFYRAEFAIRFSSANRPNFSNTVLSLSNLKKFDDRPFIVCLVTPAVNYCFLANTTFLKKVSHSSQQLRENNIKGSFNGSDITREFEGITNNTDNLERLFEIHAGIGFENNLPRLVEATTNISASGVKYPVTYDAKRKILEAPRRAIQFVKSDEAQELKRELDEKVEKFRNEILLAALIENTNIRRRIIEYLIAGEDEKLRQELVAALKAGNKGIPQFKTGNTVGDYRRVFADYHTETDVKTKIMILNSNPKAYNLDKILEFLSFEHSVFMFYFVGLEPAKIVNTVLISMFQEELLKSTILLRHWSGRNSRGVTQLEGSTIKSLILGPQFSVNEARAVAFLEEIIAL